MAFLAQIHQKPLQLLKPTDSWSSNHQKTDVTSCVASEDRNIINNNTNKKSLSYKKCLDCKLFCVSKVAVTSVYIPCFFCLILHVNISLATVTTCLSVMISHRSPRLTCWNSGIEQEIKLGTYSIYYLQQLQNKILIGATWKVWQSHTSLANIFCPSLCLLLLWRHSHGFSTSSQCHLLPASVTLLWCHELKQFPSSGSLVSTMMVCESFIVCIQSWIFIMSNCVRGLIITMPIQRKTRPMWQRIYQHAIVLTGLECTIYQPRLGWCWLLA